MVLFSFVVSDCDAVVSEENRQRFLESMDAQECKDFEVIIVHDGPRTVSKIERKTNYPLILKETKTRAKLGGDNLRPLGMQIAKGEYFINTNIDNKYYPDFIKNLKSFIESNPFPVIISTVVMKGLNYDNGRIWYDTPRDYTKECLLKGIEPIPGNIDIMNLVATRQCFEEINYWEPHSAISDGLTYQKICRRFGYVHSGIIVGEHY